MFNKQTKLTRENCLVDIYNQVLMQKTVLEVEIEILKGMPDDFVVGDKGVSHIIGGVQGKVQVKAKEAIELKEKQLFAFDKKLDAITKMLSVV